MSAPDGDTKDKFLIPKIYGDYPGRNSWYIGNLPDNRLMENIQITKLADGSGWYQPPIAHGSEFRLEAVSDHSIVDSHGSATPGEGLIATFSLPKVIQKGYLYKPVDSVDANGQPNGDFGDIEVTWRFKVSDSKGAVELVPGGLRQTGDTKKVGIDKAVPASCEAMSYHFKLDPKNGRPRFEKDTDHRDGGPGKPIGYADTAYEKPNAVASFVGKVVLHKAVLYKVGSDTMKLEQYFDETGTGDHLSKILEISDPDPGYPHNSTGWGPTRGKTFLHQGIGECCDNDDSYEKKPLTAARVAIGFRFDGILHDFLFKDCSVRSIDPSKRIHPAASETAAGTWVTMHF